MQPFIDNLLDIQMIFDIFLLAVKVDVHVNGKLHAVAPAALLDNGILVKKRIAKHRVYKTPVVLIFTFKARNFADCTRIGTVLQQLMALSPLDFADIPNPKTFFCFFI
jgi:hypothetical protein